MVITDNIKSTISRRIFKWGVKLIRSLKLFRLCFLFVLFLSISSFPASASANPKYNILIDLTEEKLFLISKDTNDIVRCFPIASGKTSTPSPIGTWTIITKGSWGKWFGSRWMGLNVPWGKYGIHGTNKPESIGTAASHGCIRMRNRDVEKLYPFVSQGTIVTIYGGPFGSFGKGFRILAAGDSGSDVYEVQKIMKVKGYYPGNPDGKFGEGMKAYVIKYRKDNKLQVSDNIDSDFYKSIGINLFE